MPHPSPTDTTAPDPKARDIARVGVIGNPRSHRNRGRIRRPDATESIILWHEPSAIEELRGVIERFRTEQVDLIVIDGGDGTVRDVMGVVDAVYPDALPRFAIIPSGKTNALAIDLDVPAHWQVNDAIAAHAADSISHRCALRVQWNDRAVPDQMGFIFGLGVFRRATDLAQELHGLGLFNSVAVVLTVALSLFRTLLQRGPGSWRHGELVRTSPQGEPKRLFLVLASTLRRMPGGLKPLGAEREGLRFLMVDAPPRALYRHALSIVIGRETAAQERAGYHRMDLESLTIESPEGIVIDGEGFPGGSITVSQSRPIEFVVPAQC